MTICYSFASRSRPTRFFETLDNIIQMSAQQNYFIVAKLDTDDTAMNNDAIKARIDSYPGVLVRWGTSKSKIHAINRDLEDLPHWDVMVCLSDDMRFRTHGFDDLIRQHMPGDLDGFIHLQDDYAKDRVATVSILGRKYYGRDNAIYNDAYFSMWCDDEETEKAKIRGKYILVPGTHIEHLHYTNNRKAVKDELYWRNDTYNADKAIFEQRKAMNFGL
jgi:adenine deaminase